MVDVDEGASLENPPDHESVKVVDIEDLRVSARRNPVARWGGKDMDSLLQLIPLSRIGHLRYNIHPGE